MIKKELYNSPDLKVRDLRNANLFCSSIRTGYSNEDLTEDETGNDYDE